MEDMVVSSGDRELALLAADGDASAFTALIDRHYTTIYRIAFRWAPKPEDAEDIAQEAAIKLARAIRSYRGEAAFTSWLYRVVINTAKDFARSNRPTGYMELDELPEHLQAQASHQEQERRLFEVMRYVEQQGEQMKETVVLVCAEGMTHKQAAEILGCAETTISWRMFRLKKLLKKFSQGEAGHE